LRFDSRNGRIETSESNGATDRIVSSPGDPMNLLARLLGMIRFSHTLFALPFALVAATVAASRDGLRALDLLGIFCCMIFARSAAMAFNRLADRRFDAANPRTASRHIPAGTLSVPTVVAFLLGCSVAFVASTLLFTVREPANWWPFYLSLPVLAFLCAYSLTKRFTSLAHYWLGVSLMLAPISAWIAIRGITDPTFPLLLAGAVLFWVAGFDILYACQDAGFDRDAKLHSIPARLGIRGALRLAAIGHAAMFGFLLAVWWTTPEFGWIWLMGVIATGGLLLWQHRLVRPDDLTRVNVAFFQLNIVISVGLLALTILEVATGG